MSIPTKQTDPRFISESRRRGALRRKIVTRSGAVTGAGNPVVSGNMSANGDMVLVLDDTSTVTITNVRSNSSTAYDQFTLNTLSITTPPQALTVWQSI